MESITTEKVRAMVDAVRYSRDVIRRLAAEEGTIAEMTEPWRSWYYELSRMAMDMRMHGMIDDKKEEVNEDEHQE